MRTFFHLLRWDFVLLQRNKIIAVSVVVTLLYLLVFRWLQSMGNVDNLLIFIVFNDPAMLGFLFIGAMVLFEKNENTLQALSVCPINNHQYLWSKATALTFVALVCCLAMVYAIRGNNVNFIHYIFATLLTTYTLSFMGFIVVAAAHNFNQYILRAVFVLMPLSLPFLGHFGLADWWYFVLIPTQSSISLFKASLADIGILEIVFGYIAAVFWLLLSYFFAVRAYRNLDS